jgi:hypothetical protein
MNRKYFVRPDVVLDPIVNTSRVRINTLALSARPLSTDIVAKVF